MMTMPTALVTKAELALATASRELAVTMDANFDAVAHHAGRCVECYLKAILLQSDIPFPESTRHLVVLLELCLELDPAWEAFRNHLRTLTTREFQAEDPEHATTYQAAQEALFLCLDFRAAARVALDAPVTGSCL